MRKTLTHAGIAIAIVAGLCGLGIAEIAVGHADTCNASSATDTFTACESGR